MEKKSIFVIACMAIICYLLVTLFCLSSCSQKTKQGYFCDNHKVIDDVSDSVSLAGSRIIALDSTTFAFSVNVVGRHIVLITGNRDSVLAVYGLDGKKEGTFGKIGNARNEFTMGLMLNGQFDGSKFWIHDVNAMSLASINIKSSLESGTVVLGESFKTDPRTMNAFYINDHTVAYDSETADNYQFKIENPSGRQTVKTIDLYPPHKDAFNTYRSNMAINGGGDRLAFAMVTLNQVNFMSLDGSERSSVSVYEDAKICEDPKQSIVYYSCIAANDRHVYALYANEKQYGHSESRPSEIHVFDWKGNFVKKILVKDVLFRIAVDGDDNVYGLNVKSQSVIKYDVASYLK